MRTEFADTRFQWSGGCLRERYDAELLMCQLTEMGVMKHSDKRQAEIPCGLIHPGLQFEMQLPFSPREHKAQRQGRICLPLLDSLRPLVPLCLACRLLAFLHSGGPR